MLSFNFDFQNTKKLCPNFLKPPLLSKIPAYTPGFHNDIGTPIPQGNFTPAKKPESDMTTAKIEAIITALKRYVSYEISMMNAKLNSFSEHANKTISNLNHQKDKYLKSQQDNISFLQKELIMKNEITKSLAETQGAALDTISALQRMLIVSKEALDAPET